MRSRDAAYISSAQVCTNWSMPCGPSFWGQGSGRAVTNQTIGKREHRLTSLTCLYRRAVSCIRISPDRNRANRVKRGSRPKLPAFNIAQWRREFSFYCDGRAYSMHAQTKLIQISWSIQTRQYWSTFFLPTPSTLDRFSTVSKFSGALFLQRRDE